MLGRWLTSSALVLLGEMCHWDLHSQCVPGSEGVRPVLLRRARPCERDTGWGMDRGGGLVGRARDSVLREMGVLSLEGQTWGPQRCLCRAVLGQGEQREGREPWGSLGKTDGGPLLLAGRPGK